MLLTVFLAVSTRADVKMTDTNNAIEITGGAGPSAWRLIYGSPAAVRVPHELVVTGDVAYFSHGTWLRRIDVKQGIVTGRWEFPWFISRIVPTPDAKVKVEIARSNDLAHAFRETILLDPEHPQIPNWPIVGLPRPGYVEMPPALPDIEASPVAGFLLTQVNCESGTTPHLGIDPPNDPLNEMIRRDPLSPLFRIALACRKAMADLPEASKLFTDVISSPSVGYSELFRIAVLLDRHQPEFARLAYERAYRDYLDRGFDPRLNQSWYFLYPNGIYKDGPSEKMELNYRIAPYGVADWHAYARTLIAKGNASAAPLWEQRANDPRRTRLYFDPYMTNDPALFVVSHFLAGFLPVDFVPVLYFIILFWRYRAARLHDRATGSGWTSKPFVTLFRLEYTDRRERVAALVLVLVSWCAAGYVASIDEHMAAQEGFERRGSLAGPANLWYWETKAPASKERDLLLAMSLQQSGETGRAERMYRDLPQFAESWNNLGVLLRQSGKDAEARSAFESALRVNPQLAEALLNLNGQTRDYWTTQYARLFPGRPMAASPSGDLMETAMVGRPLWRSFARIAGGALVMDATGARNERNSGVRSRLLLRVSFLLALLLVVPQKISRGAADAKPSMVARAGEVMVPGSARLWLAGGGILSGLVMQAWWISLFILFTPPGWYSGGAVFQIVLPAAIFALNLFLLIRAWRARDAASLSAVLPG